MLIDVILEEKFSFLLLLHFLLDNDCIFVMMLMECFCHSSNACYNDWDVHTEHVLLILTP
jgi:hypothetical protein